MLEACKLAPGLVPAAVKAADVLDETKDYRKASKLVEAAWRINPHPDLADAYAVIKGGDAALDRLKRVRSLSGLMPDALESKLALARAALDAREWPEARAVLEPLVAGEVTPRLCMLMAELEEGEHGDFGKVRQWLSRAVGASRDPVWVADGQVSDSWQPISPVTGKLDAFEWKVPVQQLAHADQPLLERDDLAEGANASEDVVLLPPQDGKENEVDAADPINDASVVADDADVTDIQDDGSDGAEEAPEAPSVAKDARADADTAADELADEIGKDLEKGAGSASDNAEAAEEGVEAEETKLQNGSSDDAETGRDDKFHKPQKVEFPLPHAPDDPGPKKDPLPESPEKRFRLF